MDIWQCGATCDARGRVEVIDIARGTIRAAETRRSGAGAKRALRSGIFDTSSLDVEVVRA
jgi:hypothetical protein